MTDEAAGGAAPCAGCRSSSCILLPSLPPRITCVLLCGSSYKMDFLSFLNCEMDSSQEAKSTFGMILITVKKRRTLGELDL